MNPRSSFRPQMLTIVVVAILALTSGFILAQGPDVSAAMQQVGVLAATEIPATFNYQGVLREFDGSLSNGTYNITAKIYANETGGSPLHTETFQNVNVRDGLFNIVLGDQVALGDTFIAAPRFMGITINPGSGFELIPRERVHGVPWAIHASNAANATSADRAITADHAITAQTANLALKAATADTFGGMKVEHYAALAFDKSTSVITALPLLTNEDAAACFLTGQITESGEDVQCIIDLDGDRLIAGPWNSCLATCIEWDR